MNKLIIIASLVFSGFSFYFIRKIKETQRISEYKEVINFYDPIITSFFIIQKDFQDLETSTLIGVFPANIYIECLKKYVSIMTLNDLTSPKNRSMR